MIIKIKAKMQQRRRTHSRIGVFICIFSLHRVSSTLLVWKDSCVNNWGYYSKRRHQKETCNETM